MHLRYGAVWIFFGLCCVPGIVYAVRRELRHDYYGRHGRWYEAPASFIGTCISGVLTGLGLGLGVAVAALFVAAIYARTGL
jgi:hypothetical protein